MGIWARHVLPRLIDRGCARGAFAEIRERLVPRARGRVLEIGVGSGHNLAHYVAGAVERVWGLDPSPELLERAGRAAREAAVEVVLVRGVAGAVPLADGAVDTVVVTWTLCSIDDPAVALAEARRVLAPGGRLLFVEHGASPDAGVRRWQRRLTPLWKRAAGGCRLDRDVAGLLAGAGFEIDELDAGYLEGLKIGSWTSRGVASR